MALDKSSTPTIVTKRALRGGTLWAITGYEGSATAETLVAAPGTGYSLYIEEFIITSDDADAHPSLQDEDGNVLFGPIFNTINGTVVNHVFKHPIKLVSNKALEIKSGAAGQVSFYVAGRTKRD